MTLLRAPRELAAMTVLLSALALSSSAAFCSAFVPGGARSFGLAGVRTTVSSQLSMSADAAASASYQKVFVAGGSKGVGKMIVDKLISSGTASEVVALVRSEEAEKALSGINGVATVRGDAFVYKDVEGAMDGCDAAITTLGGAVDDDGKRIDYEGNSNVIEAAGILGVTRVLLVTSVGCGSSREAAPPLRLRGPQGCTVRQGEGRERPHQVLHQHQLDHRTAGGAQVGAGDGYGHPHRGSNGDRDRPQGGCCGPRSQGPDVQQDTEKGPYRGGYGDYQRGQYGGGQLGGLLAGLSGVANENCKEHQAVYNASAERALKSWGEINKINRMSTRCNAELHMKI